MADHLHLLAALLIFNFNLDQVYSWDDGIENGKTDCLCSEKKLQKILGQGIEAQITSHQHQKFYFFFDQKNLHCK